MRNCTYCTNNKYCVAWKTSLVDVRIKAESHPSAKDKLLIITSQFNLGDDMAKECKKYNSLLFEGIELD